MFLQQVVAVKLSEAFVLPDCISCWSFRGAVSGVSVCLPLFVLLVDELSAVNKKRGLLKGWVVVIGRV
jgi:hypothetical protein